MAGEVVIRAEQLTKRYGADLAVDHIDLEVNAGEIVGILGPNGMRQRLGLAEVLMKRPSVAILDEPTTALDPHSTQEFLDMIRGLKADGTAVLLSSHHLDQVQSVCDRVALFNRGRIALSGTVTE